MQIALNFIWWDWLLGDEHGTNHSWTNGDNRFQQVEESQLNQWQQGHTYYGKKLCVAFWTVEILTPDQRIHNEMLAFTSITVNQLYQEPQCIINSPGSKVHGANMGPIWGWQDPAGPHVGPMNLVIWEGVTGATIHSTTMLSIL